MVVGKGSFLCHLVFVLLDIARRVDFSVQPHEDGKCSNNSNSVISVDPTSAHMVFPRKHSQFGRESVRIFHHTSRHFLKISCFVLPTGMKTEHQYGRFLNGRDELNVEVRSSNGRWSLEYTDDLFL